MSTVKDSLRTPASYAFAYGIFTNMLYNLQDTLRDYQAWIKSGDKDLTTTHVEAIKELLLVVELKQNEAYSAYAEKTGEMDRVFNLLQAYSDTDRIIKDVLRQYGFHRGDS